MQNTRIDENVFGIYIGFATFFSIETVPSFKIFKSVNRYYFNFKNDNVENQFR